jgi:hypothetical protein
LPYNRGMSDFEILLPFGLPPAELARDLLRELSLPGLAGLLSRGTPLPQNELLHDQFTRALPHEAWLAERFGFADKMVISSSPPIASHLMRAQELAPTAGYWLIVQPVHFHIARDHLVLTDARQLTLTEYEAAALFEVARGACAEEGLLLVRGTKTDQHYWFLQADKYSELKTATPDTAVGRNIDIWMPTGDAARSWRKLQNEIQMSWHAHPVNEGRQEQGFPVINSLWLWGGEMHTAEPKDQISTTTFNFSGWYAAFAERAVQHLENVAVGPVLTNVALQKVLLLDNLIQPALEGDWAEWRDALQLMDKNWFAPLAAELKKSPAGKLTVIVSDGTRLQGWTSNSWSRYKLWIKPTLHRLGP